MMKQYAYNIPAFIIKLQVAEFFTENIAQKV